jgi:hypothetical protein
MSLQERLDRIRTGFEAQAPKETLEVMHRATEDLRATGIAERVVAEGQAAPDFRLDGTTGVAVSLAKARARGPVVLTFFRGHW